MSENHITSRPGEHTASNKEARTEVSLARWIWRGLRKAWSDMTYLNERLLLPEHASESKDSVAWRSALGGRLLVGSRVEEMSSTDPDGIDPHKRAGGRAA
jgi:hypothetical protein